MKRTIRCWAAALSFVFALTSGLAGQAQTPKIKVAVIDAVIYARPEAQSQVLDRPAEGAQLDLIRKIGEWYEVKFVSKLGMVMPGYIHQNAIDRPAEPVLPAKETVPKPASVIRDKPAPPAARQAQPSQGRKILQLGIGGFASKSKIGASRKDGVAYWGEELTMEDALSDANLFGFDVRIGVMPVTFLELELGFQTASKTLTGSYRLGVPSQYYYDDIAYDEAEESIPHSTSVFTVGFVLHPVTRGLIRPYLGIGLGFFRSSLKVIKDFKATETVYLPSYNHQIKINRIELDPADLQATGFLARLGLDAAIVPALFLFVEGTYLSAKKSVKLPLASLWAGHDVTRSVDLGGGARVAFGLKLRI